VVVTDFAHDRQGEAQPPGTLLHTVNRPQQPVDTLHPSLLTATLLAVIHQSLCPQPRGASIGSGTATRPSGVLSAAVFDEQQGDVVVELPSDMALQLSP
jgi:hypothetical protein